MPTGMPKKEFRLGNLWMYKDPIKKSAPERSVSLARKIAKPDTGSFIRRKTS